MKADPNLNHEAVKLYRDAFRLCPNAGRRQDIASTVENLEVWQSVLTEWKEHKWNPLKVNWMLSDYERRLAGGQSIGERKRSQEDMPARVPERRNIEMPSLSNRKGSELRAGCDSLESIVAKAMQALRQANRSVE